VCVCAYVVLGTLEVMYMAENVSGSGLAEGVEPAIPGQDFESEIRTVRIEGTSAVITVSTLQVSGGFDHVNPVPGSCSLIGLGG